MRRKTTEEFIYESRNIFEDKFLYDKTQYSGALSKVTLTCVQHGDFQITPASHLSRPLGGCKVCAGEFTGNRCRKSTEEFVRQALEKHGDKYDYSLVNYLGDSGKVSIVCKIHGEFRQRAGSHLVGNGCRSCADYGYSEGKPGRLYILKSLCGILKVGITNRTVNVRLKKINQSSNKQFKELASFYFEDGAIAAKLEQKALLYLKSKYESIQEVFDGSTECFRNVNEKEILNYINNLPIKGTKYYGI